MRDGATRWGLNSNTIRVALCYFSIGNDTEEVHHSNMKDQKDSTMRYKQHLAQKDACRKRLVLSIAWLVLVAAGTAEVPQAIQAQWTRFQAAIKADDLSTVTAMSKFPIRSNEFGGDIPSAKVLTQRYTTIFPAPTRQCLATAPLHRETWHKRTHYEAWCDVGAWADKNWRY